MTNIRVALLAGLFLSLSTCQLAAQIPKTIAYQGVLTEASGSPVSDSIYTTTFRFYNPESTAIWQETRPVQTRRGLFSVLLGSITPFPDSLKFDRPYRLGIQISGEAQLVPLIPLNSVGYSLSSVRSDTAKFAQVAILPDSSIDSTKLANQSVTSEKLRDSSIQSRHLARDVKVPNSDSVNGIQASRTQSPNTLYPLNSFGGLELHFDGLSGIGGLARPTPQGIKASTSGFVIDQISGVFIDIGAQFIVTKVTGIGAHGEGGNIGMLGESPNGYGIYGTSSGGSGVFGTTDGTGVAVSGLASGTGSAGNFFIANSGNSSPAMLANTNGAGKAGYFSISNPLNSDQALKALTNGVGDAAYFQINNAGSVSNALHAVTNGTGLAGKFEGDVDISGNLSVSTMQGKLITLSGANLNQVLTWNGSSWSPATPTGGGGISGSGSSSYIPKFSTATSLSNSQLYDNGTNVGLGTTSPTARFHVSNGTGSNGILGETSTGHGVRGYSNSTGYGVSGYSASSYGGYFETATSTSFGLVARSNGGSSANNAFYATGKVTIDGATSIGSTLTVTGFRLSTGPTSGYVLTADASGNGTWQPASGGGGITGSGSSSYLPKFSGSTSITNSQLYDNGTNLGIGTTSPSAHLHVTPSSASYGILGETIGGPGVCGYSSSNGYGVSGYSSSAYGGYFQTGSSSSFALVAQSSGGASGQALYATGYTRIDGNLSVGGTISKGGGSFKIDHPLDPEHKFLYHSFVESPDMKNIYDGVTTTKADSESTVQLPDWFQALNRDFRYQLTVIGTFAQAIVKSELVNNQFTIKTDKPNVKVSWQITGIRQDPFANAHRIPVEEVKPPQEQGKYLYPKEYGAPEMMGVEQNKMPTEDQKIPNQE